jgi:hypothetical protein
MRVYFDADDVLHVEPENSVECMALKYWSLEYREHGSRVLVVDTKPKSEAV